MSALVRIVGCETSWATVKRWALGLSKTWLTGTQCIAKCDHAKPKAGELSYHKGDILTIVEAGLGKGVYLAQHNKTEEKGTVSASCLREREAIRVDPSLSLMPWFHGKISGPEAVLKLAPPEDGLFLVRESIRHPGDYVLCVSFQREVIHYRVIYKDSKLTIDHVQYFYNLIDMIQSYMKEKGAIATTLQKPKQKEGTKSAAEELSKAGWLLDMKKLTLGESIGEGEFGAVFKGEYMGQKVAVKNIKCDVTAQAFLEETAVMTKLQHPNLVRLLGVILHNGLHIVTEFMAKGNLVNFLRSRGRSLINARQLLRFALVILYRVKYWGCSSQSLLRSFNFHHAQSLPVIHPTLHFSDCFFFPQQKFSTRSDVWSYGVLLWETFSYGRQPYPKMTLKEVKEKVEKGYRMEAPEDCPPAVYALMRSCWENDPGKRPSFRKLREKLEKEHRSWEPTPGS
ncbi:MATK kinase, partial [Polyodon spathula]|nr:MATK kinase [Polyodon spathula]